MTTENTVAAEAIALQEAEPAAPMSALPNDRGSSLESAGQQVLRGAEPTKKRATLAVHQVRHEVRSHPLIALAATAVGFLAVGLTAGWVIGLRRSQ